MARTIVIASGKGGVGKTTVSVGLGHALAAQGLRVLLMDFDNLRSVDLVVGVTQSMVYDWGDVVFDRCAPADALCEAGDLTVLPCPQSYDAITPQSVRKLLRQLDDAFDYILLDAPAGVGTGLRLACAGAQRGIVVATADLVCVRAACTAAAQMETLGVKNTRLLINRAVKRDMKKQRLLNIDDVIDKVEVQLIGIIPEDKKIRRSAMGGEIFKKNQISYIPFYNVARRVMGYNVPLFFL